MMTMDDRTGSRGRCVSHGLLLDDASCCARCAREAQAHDGRRALGRLVVIAFVLVAMLALYRVGSASYEALTTSGASRATSTPLTTAPAQDASRLVVYTTAGCGACRLAKTWMNEHAVVYEERRVDVDDAARRELAGLGKGIVVPTFVVDNDQVLTGFDVRGVRLSQALAAHGIAR